MSELAVEVADWIATVEVEDFSPLSTGDAAFAAQLRDAVIELSDDDLVKAIVLRARGDFAPARSAVLPDPGTVFTTWPRAFSGAAALYQAIVFSKKVTMTEVSGECSGAGSALVLASDITIASEDATFGSPFRDRAEANVVLAALTIRLDRTKAWMITNRRFDARRAYEIGLANEVVPAAELQDATAAAAARVARMPLDGVVMSKMLQQPVLDVSGVGREFDMASFYASGLEVTEGPRS